MARHTIKFPLFWRLAFSLLAIVVLTGAGTIYLSRSLTSGYGCLQGNGALIDIQQGKSLPQWFSSHYGWRYRFQIDLTAPQHVLAASPAYTWAISGKHLAHIDYNYSVNGVIPWIVIDSPQENIHLEKTGSTIPIPYYFPASAGGYVWSGPQDSYSLPAQQLGWSPNGHYVLYQYYDKLYDGDVRPHSRHFSLLGIDGSSAIDFATLKTDPSLLSISRAVWSADSRFLVFPKSSSNVHLWAFDTVTKQYHRIGTGSKGLPTDVRGSRIALPQRQNDKTTITLTDLDGNHDSPLIENADDVGDPSWSPDGQHVAVVWATGQGSKRAVRLMWANQDGSETNTIEDGFWDIHDLHWLSDGRSLAYIAQRGSGVSVEIADLETGVHRQVGISYQSIAQLEENPGTGTLSLWWRSGAGQTGIDTYGVDGNLNYHTALKLNIDGIEIFRTPYRWIAYPEIYRSPDGRIYAVREDPGWPSANAPKGLELIAADGSWSRLIDQETYNGKYMYPIGEPLWSPDSQMVAFTRYNSYNPSLIVLRADGSRISATPATYATRGLSWTQCN